MKNQVLLKRYAQGLVNTIKDQAEFDALNRDLSAVMELLDSHSELLEALQSPFLPVSKKKDILRSVLDRTDLSPKAVRFVLLLVENGRLGYFQDFLTYLPIYWNQEQGIITFEVSSVVPISPDQKKVLAGKLTELENKPVFLKYVIDPSLIGGLAIRKGNIVYDISIEGSLNRLKEKILKS